MIRPSLATLLILSFGLLAIATTASAQELTPQQAARLLKRFPQIDKNGDGKLSTDEIEPIRAQLENAQKRWQKKSAPARPQALLPPKKRLQKPVVQTNLAKFRHACAARAAAHMTV